MKCEKHPEMDAIGNCVYCGRGVCELCKVRVNDLVHCKECARAGRVKGDHKKDVQPQPAPPIAFVQIPPQGFNPFNQSNMLYVQPEPKGTPTASYFKFGAAWSLICCGLSFSVGILMVIGNFINDSLIYDWAIPIFFIPLLTLSFSMLPLIGSYLGFYRNFGNKEVAYAVVIGSILQSITLGLWLYLIPLTTSQRNSDYVLSTWLFYITSCLQGIALLFQAISLRNVGIYMPPTHPTRRMVFPTILLLIITAILFMLIIGFNMIGWYFLGFSLIFLSLLFYKTPVPEKKSTG